MVNGYTLHPALATSHSWAEVWFEGDGWLPFDTYAIDLAGDVRDSAWRDHFFGQSDDRFVAEVLPKLFCGLGTPKLPAHWQLSYAVTDAGATSTSQAVGKRGDGLQRIGRGRFGMSATEHKRIAIAAGNDDRRAAEIERREPGAQRRLVAPEQTLGGAHLVDEMAAVGVASSSPGWFSSDASTRRSRGASLRERMTTLVFMRRSPRGRRECARPRRRCADNLRR